MGKTVDATKTESDVDVSAVISALTNPTMRDQAAARLTAQIAERKAELEQLERASRALSGEPVPQAVPATVAAPRRGRPRSATVASKSKSNGASKNSKDSDSKSRAGRPPGAGANHGPAITKVLEKHQGGLSSKDLYDAIVKSGHEIGSKTLSTYLNNMKVRGEVNTKGERGSFIWFLSPAKK